MGAAKPPSPPSDLSTPRAAGSKLAGLSPDELKRLEEQECI